MIYGALRGERIAMANWSKKYANMKLPYSIICKLKWLAKNKKILQHERIHMQYAAARTYCRVTLWKQAISTKNKTDTK